MNDIESDIPIYDEYNDEELSWIEWFCSLEGNELLLEVNKEFIEDEFNLYGLKTVVPNYEDALALITNTLHSDDIRYDKIVEINKSAVTLYGLIHARYIVSQDGMSEMYEKYKAGEFGGCPRVLCKSHRLIPVGTSDLPNNGKTKLFCSRCNEIYSIPYGFSLSQVDGSFFGTTFPHMLMISIEDKQTKTKFEPKIFGFKTQNTSAPYGKLTNYRKLLCTYVN